MTNYGKLAEAVQSKLNINVVSSAGDRAYVRGRLVLVLLLIVGYNTLKA